MRIVVEPKELLRRVGQQIQEGGAGLVFGVDRFGLVDHPQRVVVAASRDTRGTALAQVGDEDGEDAARPRLLALRSGEDGIDLLVGHGNFVDDGEELALGLGREAVHVGHDFAENLRQRSVNFFRDGVGHHLARALVDLGDGLHHLSALAGIGDVAHDRGVQDCLQILRAVGQRRVRTHRDALHTLRAVFCDVERRFAARDVLRRGVAGARGHDADGGIGIRWLVIAEASAELAVESRDPGHWSALGLLLGSRVGAASDAASVAVIAERRQ